MTTPIPTLNQPFNYFIPGTGITIDIDSGLEDEGDNEITISASGSGTPFTVGGVFKTPSGADDVLIWVAAFGCTVTAIKTWQDTGTGSAVNAFTGSLASPVTFLVADHTILAADTVEDAGVIQNPAISVGDPIYVRLTSAAGSPNEVGVQLSFTRT